MSATQSAPAVEAVISLPVAEKPRPCVAPLAQHSNPFGSATAAAAADFTAAPPIPIGLSAVSERALVVRTPSQSFRAGSNSSKKQVAFSSRFKCCLQPAVIEEDAGIDQSEAASSVSPLPSHQHKKGHSHDALSPKKSLRAQVLTQQGSMTYSDAEWFDARSELSSALSGMTSDPAAKLEELSAMLKEMHGNTPAQHPAASHPALNSAINSPALNPAVKCPWIPEPVLAFGDPSMQFMPVTAHTGFAAYWERDQERSTPYPTPIDVMIKASMLAMKSHESIPGIWLQETDSSFTVTVKPRFMPPGLPRYTETYDKTNATEPSWAMRRDLRIGSTSGQIYMTTDGMLILRARSKPLWGSDHDFIMEEYMRLEDGGKVIVDRMCCLCIKSGRQATQYVVGHYHAVPPKGHV